MKYIVEIPETSESKGLINHLKTLKYVRFKKPDEKKFAERKFIKDLKIPEKGKHLHLK